MKRLQYILPFLAFLFLLSACYDDDSTLGVGEITEINISSNVSDTINLYLGDPISIIPQSSDKSEEVTWQWSMGKYRADAVSGDVTTVFKEIATTRELEYKTTGLGHYYLRLVAGNRYGSTIKYYHVFVNSEFEEGFLILGKKEDGKGSLAFMKTLTPEELAQGMSPQFRQNLFAYVNEGKELGEGPVDCDKVYDKLYILCGKEQKVYQIDAKSFQLIYEFDYHRYGSDFYPQDLISYDSRYCREIYSTSPQGGVAKIQQADLEIYSYEDLPQHIPFTRTYDRPNKNASKVIAFIDDVNNQIYAHGVTVGFQFMYFNCYDYFHDRKIIQVFFDEGGNLIVYHKKEGKFCLTKISSSLSDIGSIIAGDPKLDINYERECTVNRDLFNEESVFEVNDPNTCLLFSNGSNIYKWSYNQSEIPAEVFIPLPEGEMVKCMNQSADQKQLYVATYNNKRSGLKGSLYIYDVDTGKLIGEPFEGVADEPVKVMYKIK